MSDKPAVIVPLDGSDVATVALGAAQAIARIMKAVLYIVNVSDETLTEEQLIEKLKIGRLEIKDFSMHQITGGDPIDGILRFAASVNTQMIVMSTHGWTYNPEYRLGEVTKGVVQRAINPVMVIRPGMAHMPDASWTPSKMLVPQDGSPTAASVMVQVFHLAQLTKAEIDVLNIGVVGAKMPTEVGTIRMPMYQDHPRYDWPGWASEFKERLGRFYAEKRGTVQLLLFEREGEPVQVMNEFAAENNDDLIAIGWHGHLESGRAPIIKQLLETVEIPLILIWSRE